MEIKSNIKSIVITSIVLTQLFTSCASKPIKGEAQYNQFMGTSFSLDAIKNMEDKARSGDRDAIDAMCYSDTIHNVTYTDGSSFCTQ